MVQWTAHIPQAMQRHGGSIEPETMAESDAAMSRFLDVIRQPGAAPDSRAELRAKPAARPSSS